MHAGATGRRRATVKACLPASLLSGEMEMSVDLRLTLASGGPPKTPLTHADPCVFIIEKHSDWLGAWETTSELCNCLSLGVVFCM